VTTFLDVVNECDAMLHSYTEDLEQNCTLTGSLASTLGGTVSVDDATQVSRGLVQVDDELVWVSNIDRSAGTITIPPWGRGQQGSTSAAQSANARVTNNPRYPRARIRQTLNEVLLSLYPDLFAVHTDETNTSVAYFLTYPLPADALGIVDARWQAIGPTKMWIPIRQFRTDMRADTTAFPTGKTMDIYTPMVPGRTIKITYRGQFTSYTADTDLLTASGLQESGRECLVYGAVGRMLQAMDAARLELDSVEQGERFRITPTGAAGQAAARMFAMFQQRVQQERANLIAQFPIVPHKTG
jgi:hypothetical protein